MLDHIMEGRKSDGSEPTDDEIFVEAELLLCADPFSAGCALRRLTMLSFAGTNSIASTVTAAIRHLIQNPACLQSLRQDIDMMMRRGNVSDPPTNGETMCMPYLAAVLRETLRLSPAPSANFLRTVPAGGAAVGGFDLPPGTTVGASPWAVHHRPDIYGSDADEFRPERWYADAETRKRMARNAVSFGLASHTCVGQDFAQVAMQKVLAQVTISLLGLLWPSHRATRD